MNNFNSIIELDSNSLISFVFRLTVWICLGVIWIFPLITNPVRNRTEVIRDRIIYSIPLGSSRDEVLNYINSREGWTLITAHDIGSIRVYLGFYRFFFFTDFAGTDVSVIFHFDELDLFGDIIVERVL